MHFKNKKSKSIMQEILTKFKSIKSITILIISSIIAFLGFFATWTLNYIGTYKPDLKYFTLTALFLLAIIFALTIITLIYRISFSWKLNLRLTLIIFLLVLMLINVDLILTIIQLGWIKCDTCP
jgi:hypothetical protein